MALEQLREFGMAEMTDRNVREFLASQKTGVLGLPAESAPYLLPLSFGYDGDATLYFTYVTGRDSRKEQLSERADAARFLVFSAETAFNWESAVLTGRVEAVPRSAWDDHAQAMADNGWRPDVFERASESGRMLRYRFAIDDWTGLRHSGLPPGFEHGPGE